jgi:D-beta-D-heptose 7-phosphate kinase/D-beta-D-heptose 1-phosphate adenosyltransferase
MNDIFGPGSNVGKRVFRDHDELRKKIEACRALGLKIVLTSGTFDLLHIGHCRYLEEAKGVLGDPNETVLVVGVDSDEKVKVRKGRNTIVAEDERIEILCHQRHADLIFLKQSEDEHWQLIRTVRPDALIVSETTKERPKTDEEREKLLAFCSDVRMLPPQATTSTTARIRLLLIGFASQMREKVEAFHRDMLKSFQNLQGDGSVAEMRGKVDSFYQETMKFFRKLEGGGHET